MSLVARLHDFTRELPPDVLQDLDAASRTREFREGDHVLRAGQQATMVFQVQAGRVKYAAWDHRGRETVLTYMTSGDWVGLSEVFTRLPAQWNVVAQSAVTVRAIAVPDFERLVETYPILARQLLRVFALRFSLHRLFGLDHSGLSLKERVIKMLWFLSFGHDKDADDDAPVVLKLSQEELSKVVGASRQKLNPALKALEQEGLLTVQFGSLSLRGRGAIRERYGYLLDMRS